MSASTTNFAGLTQEADEGKNTQVIFTSVETDLQASVVKVDDDGAWILFDFADPDVKVVANGELAIAQGEAIKADLGRGMLARIGRRGRITAVHFDRRTSATAQGFARALLAAAQVVLPADTQSKAWDACETDPNGEARVQYKREEVASSDSYIAVLS